MTTHWLKAPLWDGLFMLSALWLMPFVLLLDDLTGLYLLLTLVFWIGHRVSSSYLAYCTSSYRQLLTTQRTRFVWVPLAIATGVLALLLPTDDMLPWPRSARVMALVLLDFWLLTYHFAAQHYGVLSLYRLRAGGVRSPRAKRIDRWFALGVGGVLVACAEALAGTLFFLPTWGQPGTAFILRLVGTGLVATATVAVLFVYGRERSTPRTLYVLTISLVVLAAYWLDPMTFLVLWTVQHWTAAVGLATLVARGDTQPGTSRWYRLWFGVHRQPAALLAFLVVVSVVLFPLMEVEAAGDVGSAGLTRLVNALATSAWAPLLLAFAFASAFVHYQLDRAVFRFSDPDVRRAASSVLAR